MSLLALLAAGGAEGAGTQPDFAPSETHLAAGEIAAARALAEAALDAAGTSAASDEACAAIEALATRFYETGSLAGAEAAESLLERSLALRERGEGDHPAALGTLLHDLSGLAFNRRDYARSEALERRALEVRERTLGSADPATIESRRDLGFIFEAQGRLAEARPWLEQALAALEAAPEPDPAAVALGQFYLAELDRIEGRYAEAEARLVRLVLAGPDGLGRERSQFPSFLNNLAGVYRDQERFAEAEPLLRRSLELRERSLPPDDGAVARAKLNLAELYRQQGKFNEAESLYREARVLATKAYGKDNPGLIEFASQLGVLYREHGLTERAEPLFVEALRLAENGGGQNLQVAAGRLDLAELQRVRSRCADARANYARAREIRERILGPDHPDVAEVLVAEAACLVLDPRTRADARRRLDRGIGILEGSEAQPVAKIRALDLRAGLRRAQDPDGAEQDLAAALSAVEQLRPQRGGGESARAEFLDRYLALYSRRIRWDVEAGRPARALEVAERARARVLLDQLAAARVGEHDTPRSEKERRQAAVRAHVAELRRRIESARSEGEPRTDLVADLERQLDAATRELRDLWDETRNASQAWRRQVVPAPPTAEALQREVVPRDGFLLQYTIGNEGAFVFLVPPAPAPIETFALALSLHDAQGLGVAAGRLSQAGLLDVLAGPAAQDGARRGGLLDRLTAARDTPARGIGGISALGPPTDLALHALWNVLLPEALWRRIRHATRVVVVPDGPLCLLPFEALVVVPDADPRRRRYWLDEGPAIRYAPSATVLEQLGRREIARRPPPRGSVLSVSDPAYTGLERLPGTALESRAILETFGDRAGVVVLEGAQARESAVRREIGDKRYVHLATHGLVDERSDGLFAALAFALPASGGASGDDDGFLQLFEVYELALNCDLAVLSACSSNVGRIVSSEGVFALSRGFLVAGARRVVASQWAVDDASTAELIGGLFRRIAGAENAGRPVDATLALRDAKLALRQQARFANPFFWSPLVISGID